MNAKEALKKESILASEGLKGAGMYVEYRTDDARLTMEVAKSAAERGAKLINYVKADSFLYEDGKLVGVQATDRLTGESVKIYARKIINATGPWVDTLREQDRSREGKSIHHTKGVHLVLSKERLPLHRAVYFDTPFGDGRMMFAIPRGKKVYVGTTDTNFKGDQTEPGVTIDDVNYILDATNQLFPGYHLTKTDVESSWSGIRPLIHEDGKDPSEISRKDEIFHSKSGLMTIAGGKLTGYRKMADTIVTIAAGELTKETGKSYPSCQTKEMALSGGHVGGSAKYEAFKQKMIQDGVEKGLTQDEAQEIAERYGSNAPAVFSYIEENNQYDLPGSLYAMLRYGIEQEMTVTAVDFLMRRVSYLLFDIDQVDAYKDRILNAMSDLLQWSEEEKQRYSEELNEQVNLVTLRSLH